jgi:hypothetical protein
VVSIASTWTHPSPLSLCELTLSTESILFKARNE